MLPDYEIVATLYENAPITVYRARRRSDGHMCVVKTLGLGSTREQLARLRYEYKVLQQLASSNAENVTVPLTFLEQQGEMALVLEDIGATSLKILHKNTTFTLREVLHIGIEAAKALASVHAARVIHKDINPNNIILNRDTSLVQVIDFNIASQIAHEQLDVDSLRSIEGTLAYVSPEQTGKMNRPLDYRTDFYALGVTLYELLAGHLPFAFTDAAQLTHAILSVYPPALRSVAPNVPEVVEAIVAKLMRKIPEERYQSAQSLARDLSRCLKELDTHGQVAPFTLGENDRSDRFEIPAKLYGRERDVEDLMATYQQVAQGKREILLVKGPSGIGKSHLINELQRPIVEHDGMFAAGKYEQLRRHIPFSAFGQAIKVLVHRILKEDAAVVQSWQRRIQSALGQSGQALVDIAPDLELLVGKQRPAVKLPPQESENRLLAILQRLMRAWSAAQPLTLFLDDVQWADQASLRFLSLWADDDEPSAGLLLILSYRDNEVTDSHPLLPVFEKLRKSTTPVKTMAVQPLSLEDVGRMLADSTGHAGAPVTDLAKILMGKTAGNPFFLRAFIKYLRDKDFIQYDRRAQHWTWDLEQIRSAAVTDNVATLMADEMVRLPAAEREALSVAACLGSKFKLSLLSSVIQRTRSETAALLAGAVKQEMILPQDNVYRYAEHGDADITYKFAHDRVQQAAYEAQTSETTLAYHLKIGRTLLDAPRTQDTSEWIFDVLGHLNAARAAITSTAERHKLAELNLQGAVEAKKAASYALAMGYAKTGIECLPDGSWESHYDLTWNLYLELADAQLLSGLLEESDQNLSLILERSKSPLEKAQVLRRRVWAFTSLDKNEESVLAAEKALRVLGLPVRIAKINMLSVVAAVMRVQWLLRGKDLSNIEKAPRLADERLRMSVDVLSAVILSSHRLGPLNYTVVALTLLELSLKYGNSPLSPVGFAAYSVVMEQFSDYKKSLQFSQTVLRALDEFPDAEQTCMVHIGLNLATGQLRGTPEQHFADIVKNFNACIENGQPLFACIDISVGMQTLGSFSLERSREEGPRFMKYLRDNNLGLFHLAGSTLQVQKALRGETRGFTCLDDDEGFSEEKWVSEMTEDVAKIFWDLGRTQLYWLMGDVDRALGAVRDAMKHHVLEGMVGSVATKVYMALAIVGHAKAHKLRRLAEPRAFARVDKLVRSAAEASPARFGGLVPLLDAEMATWKGHDAKAASLYEQAIQGLQGSGFPGLLGVACEAAALCALRRGLPIAAATYMDRARHAYLTWGAHGKIRQLDEAYPQIKSVTSRQTVKGHTISSTELAQTIDLPAVLRANQALSMEVVLDNLLKKITTSLLECAGANRVALFLHKAGGLAVAADSQGEGAPLPTELVQYVGRSRESVIIADAKQPHEFTKMAYFEQQSVRSVLCSPILHHGEMVGALYLENNLAPNVFAEDKMFVVKLLSAQAAISLRNSQLYASLEEAVAERTGQLNAAHEKLLKMEKESTEVQMAGGFAHEMRNALSAANYSLGVVLGKTGKSPSLLTEIREHVQAMQKLANSDAALADIQRGVADATSAIFEPLDMAEELAKHIDESVSRSLKITLEILRYAQVGSIMPGEERTDLAKLVDNLLQEFRGTFADNAIVFAKTVPDALGALIKEEHAYIVLHNLLANASDAVAQVDTSVRRREIRVQGEMNVNQVVLSIEDTGPGIDSEVSARIFQPFFSTKGAKGMGLGLGLSKKLIEVYGGKITYTSEVGQGARFSVSLPRKP